jgi:hypothetical protein
MRAIGILSPLVIATAFGTLAACGGSTDSGGGSGVPGADAGGSPSLDSGATPHDDAGTSSDATSPPPDASDTYPAAHYPLPTMTNHGGPVMTDMKIITVTFVGDAKRDEKRTFDDTITKTAWWDAVTRGYGIHRGSGGGYVELPDTVSNQTLDNDTQLIPMLQKLVTDGKLPAPDANTIYALYFPQSTTIQLLGMSSCQTFGAYHDYTHFTAGGQDVLGAFAVMPDCGNGFSAGAASHEFIEAATDPHPFTTKTPPDPFSFYLYNDAWCPAGGYEVADMCEGQKGAPEGNYTVARSWVNAAALESKDPCQPSDPALVFFGAAVETEVVTGLHDPTGGPDYDADGFLVVKAGATKTANVVVFSEAKLAHDVSLVVGKRKANTSDPTVLDPIAAGVDAKLTQTTAHNGAHVTLTITTSASTPPGDYRFVVRAILETTDYHSWPVVLRVK